MSTEYTLTATNNSTQFQDICVFQKPVDLGVPNATTLAWLTAPAWPGTTVKFTWLYEYNFVWSQTGSLKPGVVFEAQQTLPADPDNMAENQIQFDYSNGAFTFLHGASLGTPQLGSLYIRELDSIPPGVASVGIGMSNAGTFVVPSQPNVNLVFTPHPQFWIAAGTFTQGEVLDIEEIDNPAQVSFDGTFSMKAELNAKNLWSISNG